MMKRLIAIVILLLTTCINNYIVYAYSNSISVNDKYYAIKNDDTLWTWDKDKNGEVQNIHKILEDVQSIQNGYAIQNDGSVWECEKGIFGKGENDVPAKVIENVVSISANDTSVLFKKNDNSLWGIGSNWTGEMATGEETGQYDKPVKIMYNVKDTANGYSHTVILKTDGSVWTAGTNDYGVLGVEKSIEYSLKPLKIMDGISKIYAGETSTFAIDENNTLYRWGCNYGNGVGISDEAILYAPVKYTDNVKSVCSHWGFNLILKQDGTLWIYGDSEDSAEGYTIIDVGGANLHGLPKKIFDNVNSISEWKNSESHSTLILKNNGELYEFNLVGNEKDHSFEMEITKIMDDVKLSSESLDEENKDYTDILSQPKVVQQSINLLSKANIISGTSETEFSPDKPITRAEIAAMLLRMTAKNYEDGNGGFLDVTTDDWYYNTAGASKKYNIVAGFEDNTFRGDETVSAVQLVSLAARVLRNEKNLDSREDINFQTDIPDWAKGDVALAMQEELISVEKDLINPNEPMTRGEAAVILYRLYNKI